MAEGQLDIFQPESSQQLGLYQAHAGNQKLHSGIRVGAAVQVVGPFSTAFPGALAKLWTKSGAAGT